MIFNNKPLKPDLVNNSILLLLLILSNVIYAQNFQDINTLMILSPRQFKKPVVCVYLKDSTVLKESMNLYSDKFYGHEYMIISNKKITPIETDSIKVDSIIGIPYNGAWIWSIKQGKVTLLYDYFPVPNKHPYRYVKKNNEIFPFTHRSLETVTFDNIESNRMVKNYENNTIIAVSCFFGGICIFGSSIAVKPGFRSIPISVGLLSFSVSIFEYAISTKNLKKAISIYNKR